ncbi:sigma-70 family RNA polymerase sigma factor [Bosea sp. CS1GBMeth4]|uniref:RNA polymerase sigma factor n=1 Tax=Bosea sp. CS1GBMeth4 TaxID=1892849 RepID=UPI0016467892|nr:sigma-70 family RNA polymerase sigma factor [Bosea sp. CS1GBMeth4]
MLGSVSDLDIEAQIPALRRFARSLARNADDADELVQDTLLQALSRWRQLQKRGSVRAWLFQILFNLHRTQGRSRQREWARFTHDDGADCTDPSGDQSQALHLGDALSALVRLPQAQRIVLELVAVEEMTYEEVARVTDVPIGTVMSRLSRARERLRIELEGGNVTPFRRIK